MQERLRTSAGLVMFVAAVGIVLMCQPASAQCPPSFWNNTTKDFFDLNGPPLRPGDPVHMVIEVCQDAGEPWYNCGGALALSDPLSLMFANWDESSLTYDPTLWRGSGGTAGCFLNGEGLTCVTEAADGQNWIPGVTCTTIQFDAEILDPFLFSGPACNQGDLWDFSLGQGSQFNSEFCDPDSTDPEIPSWGCTVDPQNPVPKAPTCREVEKPVTVVGEKTVTNLTNPGGFTPGDTLEYRLCFTNNGTSPVGGLSVTDFLPADSAGNPVFDTTPCADSPPLGFVDENSLGFNVSGFFCNQTNPELRFSVPRATEIAVNDTVCATFVVTTDPNFTESVCNRAQFTYWSQFDPLPVPPDQEPVCLIQGGPPDFSTSTKDASPRGLNATETVSFAIHVDNATTVNAPDLQIRDLFDPGCFDFSSQPAPVLNPVPAVWSYNWLGNELIIDIADAIPGGYSLDVSLDMPTTLVASGQCCNRASIDSTFPGLRAVGTSDFQDPTQQETCVDVTGLPQAALGAVKTSNPAPGSTVQRGDTITYTITLTETGLVEDATEVTVADILLPCLDCTTFAAIQPAAPDLFIENCDGSNSPVVKVNPMTIARNASQDIVFSVQVDSAAATGDCCNADVAATYLRIPGQPVSVGSVEAPGVCVSVPTAIEALLAADKTSSPAPGTNVQPGETITYTITLSEVRGRQDATEVTLSDALPACLDCTTFTAIQPADPELWIEDCTPGGTPTVKLNPMRVAMSSSEAVVFAVDVDLGAAPGDCCNEDVQVSYLKVPGQPASMTSAVAQGVCVTVPGVGIANIYREPADAAAYCNPLGRADLSTLFPIDLLYGTSALPVNVPLDLPATGPEPPIRSCQVFYFVTGLANDCIMLVKGDDPVNDVKIETCP